jgi:hypothetical protein
MSSTAASSKPVSRNMSVQRSSIASSVTGASMLEEEQQDSKLSSMERIDDLIVKYREVLERRKDDFYEQRHIRIDDLPRRLDPEKYPDIFASISSMSSSRRTSSGLRRSLSAGSRRRDSNSSTTSDELRRRSSVSGSLRSLRSLSRPGTGTERRKRQRSKAKSAAQNANGVRFSLNSAQDISSVIQSEVKENQDVVMIDLETPQQAPYASPFLLRAVFRPNINEPRIADPVEPDLSNFLLTFLL